MAIGSRRKRGSDEYIFVDGHAMRTDDVVRIELSKADMAVPGQSEALNKADDDKAAAAKTAGVGADAQGADEGRASGTQRERAGFGRKTWSAKRAIDELESSPAFAALEGSEFAAEYGHVDLRSESKRYIRRVTLVAFVVLIVVASIVMCTSIWYTDVFYSPGYVVQVLAARFRLFIGETFHQSWYNELSALETANALPGFGDICERCDNTLITIAGGLLLALSGMLYQNVFRNPIAAPNMLGVSSGVRIGTIIMVITFGEAAADMESTRYLFAYVGGAVILLGVLGFSKLAAGRHRAINVVDMLIVGSVFSQLLSSVSSFFLTYLMDDDLWEVFYELTSGMRTDADPSAFLFMTIVICATVIPVFLARYRLNITAFEDGEARLMGVNPVHLRVVVLILGTFMILAAQIHVGIISMVSLVVPFLVRYVVGSEFGKQFVGNLFFGPILLLVCREVCGLIPFVGEGLSLEMVVGFVALPVYIWMMALGKRGWE